jgi:DNA-binding MarR family transcriptional regulator
VGVEDTFDPMLLCIQAAVLSAVRRGERDLSTRQLSVFLICYLDHGPHTVRSLAAALNISKPAIGRALNRLEALRLARRKPDPRDRRSVIVAHTTAGNDFLRELRTALGQPI